MRPLFHPAPEDLTVEGLLHALSDPVRAAIFREIAAAAGPVTCSAFLTVKDRDIPKSTLSQHFKVLRESGLIRSERQGVEMHSTARSGEVDARFPGLLAAILSAHARQQKPTPASRRGRASAVRKPGRRAAGKP
ncbi:MAG TPA: helix-turn-helix domain-containing protein [Casimicrobiaceae bacterium]